MSENGVKCGAVLSDDRLFRYELTRQWDSELPWVNFIGLNPSTADETNDDPTIRRCVGFGKRWGFGGIRMTNLFAFRATLPKDMLTCPNPIGEVGTFLTPSGVEFTNRNDFWLWTAMKSSGLCVAAWGRDGRHLYRGAKVKLLLGTGIKCFGKNADGTPKHPLYLKAQTVLIDL